jgi:Putative Flp pilus-assembly TadE/G-like
VTIGRDAEKGARGQALVIMVGGMLAVIVMVGLIIDGGNAWAQQRIVQNGSDAAAEAGAVVLAQWLTPNAIVPGLGWDGAVQKAVNDSAAANGIKVTNAYYTDICGIPLRSDGTAALNADNSYDLADAQPVGSGLPKVTTTPPVCPSHTVGPVAGVLVLGHKDVGTYLVNVVGISSWSVNTQATAAAGLLTEAVVLPVTIPVNIVTCDNSNNPIFPGNANWVTGVVYKVPLCGNSPGNVGWLDWTPPAGGTSELVCSILHPNNPLIPVPSWQYVTSTGNVNGGGGQCGMSVQDAIRTYDGTTVTIPLFDLTCNPSNGVSPANTDPALITPPNYGCPAGALGGSGQNQRYRFKRFAHFHLCISTDLGCTAQSAPYGAYISGNDKAVCDTGNGATSCLVGKFVDYIDSGTIASGAAPGGGSGGAVGIQLIK